MKQNIAFILFNISFLILIVNGLSAQADSYSFFIAGHSYGEQGVNNVGLHPPLKEKFPLIQSNEDMRFGVLLGDVVYMPSAEDWDEVDVDIANLGLPVYIAVGNHDMINRQLYENRYGSTYFSFTCEKDLFVVLDPLLDEWNISEDQLLFLQEAINDNAEGLENVFIMIHQLLWYEDDNIYSDFHPNGLNGRADTINFWSEIIPYCKDLEYEFFFCAGDVGANQNACNFMYDKFDNITFIATGMGDGDGENFIVVNVNENKSIDYELICLNNSELYCYGDLTDYDLSINKENKNGFECSVYPNPVDKYFNVILDDTSRYIIELFDCNGRSLIRKESDFESEIKINCQDIKSGVYLLSISNENIREIIKIIKY